MITDVIESFNGYIQKVTNGSIQIANLLKQDQITEALQMILDFSEGMIWLVDASELLQKNDIKANVEIEKVHEFLNEINTGLEKQDYVLVADMFEYEIATFFEGMQPIEGISN